MPGTDERSRWEGILERNVLLWWRPQSHRTPPSFGNLKEHPLPTGKSCPAGEKHSESLLRFSSPQSPPHPFHLPAGDFPGPELNSLSPSPPRSLVSPSVLCSPQVDGRASPYGCIGRALLKRLIEGVGQGCNPARSLRTLTKPSSPDSKPSHNSHEGAAQASYHSGGRDGEGVKGV